MKILAIETATLMGGVALTSEDGLLAELRVSVKTTHSEQLMALVDRVLKSSETALREIDAFAVSIGPGSFTGLRIGLSTVKGFSVITGKPVLPVSTLEALAYQIPFSNHPLCPILDARKGELYTALFRFKESQKIQRLWEDQVRSPSALAEQISHPAIFLGNGLLHYGERLKKNLGDKLIFAPKQFWFPSALNIAELARQKWHEGSFDLSKPVLPHYVRRSEAEVKWEKLHQRKTSSG